ncbi:MAG: hypothetical protein FJZ04_01565 [Candidatus Moranbacteria bacterium]|nr:hypothetical protein [Candidatus Moranbacteria bacterium]
MNNLRESTCIGCWNEKGNKNYCIVDENGKRCERLAAWQDEAMKSISYGHPSGGEQVQGIVGTGGLVPPKPRYYER